MKKILAIILTLCMLLSVISLFSACEASGKKESTKKHNRKDKDDEEEETEETEEDEQESYTAENTKFVIGVSGPLTGGAAIYGQAVENGAKMAVEEINAAGGLDGVKFKLIVTDDQHDATKVAANYFSMLEQGMQVSLGTVTTAPGLEFKNLSKDDNVFFLTPSASGDAIPEFDNGFQMCFADGNQGKVAAEYVNNVYAGQTIGIFYKADDAYSKGIYDQFKANLSAYIKTVETSFTDAAATNFDSQIDKLKDCSFIFMPTYYDPAARFMTQGKDKIKSDAIYYGCDGFDGIDNIEGFNINSIPQEISMLSNFDSKAAKGTKTADFVYKYTEKYGQETLNSFAACAYDSVYAIYGAMRQAVENGEEIDVTISASDLCEILKEQFETFALKDAVTGTYITWDKNGFVNKAAERFVIKEGTAPENNVTEEKWGMTHEEFMAMDVDCYVEIEAYVQATQDWWNDTISVYAQTEEGGYFIYNMTCSEADAARLVPGTKIRVSGFKTTWEGLHEVMEGATFEIVEDAQPYIAQATDLTALLGVENLEKYQSMRVSFRDMKVEASIDTDGNEVAFLYGWDGSGEAGSDSDLYFMLSKDGKIYNFVVEYYLCNENSEVYRAVQNLQVGDLVNVECFLYWYNGIQPHVVSITAA